jgi:hypothetical protein
VVEAKWCVERYNKLKRKRKKNTWEENTGIF